MNFETMTAYDIGCEVYVTEFYEGYTVCGPCVITNIEINISAERTKISYFINKDETFLGCFAEGQLFRTYEDCAEWCKKHG